MAPYLNQVLALRFRHERLKLGSGEGVDKTSLGHDQKKHLGAGEDGQLVCLWKSISTGSRRVTGSTIASNAMREANDVATRRRVGEGVARGRRTAWT